MVQQELGYQGLCRALEIENIQAKGLTVMEFESAISLIAARKKAKNV